jgi:hypothetical protein
MKTGIAKDNLGFPNRHIKPDPKCPVLIELGKSWRGDIVKGSRWQVPDNYNFKRKESLFTEYKPKK